MYDAGCLSSSSLLQRAVGELRIVAKRRGSETVLDELRQVGCLKARFPKRIVPGWMDVVMLNTGGGVVGGDRLDVLIEAGLDTQMTVAAQAAERFYRTLASDPPSRVRARLIVAAGASLEWLPQEAILFDCCALDRRIDVHLDPQSRFLGVETLVFGRVAMGEQVHRGWLQDVICLRRGDEPLLFDAIRIDGDIEKAMAQPAVSAGARVVATIVCAAPDVAEDLDAVRAALKPVEAGASAWNGMMIVRILGSDSLEVREAVTAVLGVLRRSRALPRVWS